MCNCHLTCIGTVGQQGHLGCKNTNLAKTKVFFWGGYLDNIKTVMVAE